MNLDQKKQIAEELHENFSKSKVVILTDYKGLDVASITSLRKKLRDADVQYKVVKNTLIRRAAKDTDVALIEDQLKGPSAVAFSYDDPVAPAKVLSDFAKENEKLEIKIGVMNGSVLDQNAIKALSALPSREELLSQVLSAMNAIPTSLVRALADAPRRLVNVLQALKDKQEAA